MRKNKFKIIAAAAILSIAAGAGINAVRENVIVADAGSSKVYVVSEASVTQTGISAGTFFITGDVTAKDGKAVFGSDAGFSSLFAKAKIRNLKDYGVSELFTASLKLNIKNITESGKFSVCFGLKNVKDYIGAANSFDIEFTYDNGIYVGVNYYDEDGNQSAVYKKQKFGALALGKDITLDIVAATDNKLTVKINGDAYVSNRSVADLSGYVSFCSEGKNNVVLSDAKVISYKYDAPETIDYTETFENGYNANVFASQSKASPMNPSSLSVEDGKLVFRNTAGAYFTTRYQYSNFELTFDISDLYNEAEFNEIGEPTKLISNWFGIAFGVDSIDLSADATVPQTSWLQFEGVPIYSTPPYGEDHTKPWENPRYVTWENGNARDIKPMYGANGKSFSLWNKHDVNGNTVNVKFTMNDGLIELYYRIDGDEDWGTPYYSYDLGAVRTGYVRIFTWGDTALNPKGLAYQSVANFKIDNFSIRNTDNDAAKKYAETPGYKSNIRDKTPDFDYTTEPDKNDLLSEKIKNGSINPSGSNKPSDTPVKGGCNSSLTAGLSAGAAMLALLPAGIILLRRKKDEE